MTADNSRRQRRAASTTTQVSSSSAGGDPGGIPESLVRWLTELVSELRGAIEDHRKWTDSDRARSLGNAFVVVGRFLTYAAYLVLAYQTFDSYVDADRGIAAGHYAIPA